MTKKPLSLTIQDNYIINGTLFFSSMVRTINDSRQSSFLDHLGQVTVDSIPEKPLESRKTSSSDTRAIEQVSTISHIEENTDKIEDVGEKIGGARKDEWTKNGLSLVHFNQMTDAEQLVHVSRDNIWPINIRKESVDGPNDIALAFCKQIRSLLPISPQKTNIAYLRNYVRGIALLRDAFNDAHDMPAMLAAWESQVSLWQELLQGADAQEWQEVERAIAKKSGRFRLRSPLPHKQRLSSLIKDAVKDVLSGFPQGREAHYVTFAKLQKGIDPAHSADGETSFVPCTRLCIESITSDVCAVVMQQYNKEPYRFELDTEGVAAARDHVRAWFAEQFPGLVEKSENKEANEGNNDPWKRKYLSEMVRNGVDYRQGRDVEAQDFITEFGFRAVEFGNWVNQEERQEAVNHAFDALMDLADVLSIEPSSLSLKGRLALGFGSRGRGGASAHYEPGRMVINLTKTSGSGSLAHEWFHGFGHYLAPEGATDVLGRKPAPHPSQGAGSLNAYARKKADEAPTKARIQGELKTVFNALFTIERDTKRYIEDVTEEIATLKANIAHAEQCNQKWRDHGGRKASSAINHNDSYIRQISAKISKAEQMIERVKNGSYEPLGSSVTDFFQNAVNKTGSGNSGYYARPLELFARAGEAVVQILLEEQGKRSDYLVTLPCADAYPQGAELANIKQAMQGLFAALCEEPEGPHGLSKKKPVPISSNDREHEEKADHSPDCEESPLVSYIRTSVGERINRNSEPLEAVDAPAVEEAPAATAIQDEVEATTPANSYEARLERRRSRLEAAAGRSREKAQAFFQKADLREEASGIPFGQPILVGHHSEGKHRRAIERAHNAFGKAVAESERAEQLQARAESVGEGGISADDPEAIAKLTTQLEEMEAAQVFMKRANKLVRKALKAGVQSNDGSEAWNAYFSAMNELRSTDEERAVALLNPDCVGNTGFAGYMTSNNAANMRRVKARIEQLKKLSNTEHTERNNGIFTIIENPEENRLQLVFDGKPDAATRTILKQRGFRWAPSQGAWQRQLNNAARYAAEIAEKQILADLAEE